MCKNLLSLVSHSRREKLIFFHMGFLFSLCKTSNFFYVLPLYSPSSAIFLWECSLIALQTHYLHSGDNFLVIISCLLINFLFHIFVFLFWFVFYCGICIAARRRRVVKIHSVWIFSHLSKYMLVFLHFSTTKVLCAVQEDFLLFYIYFSCIYTLLYYVFYAHSMMSRS